MASPQKVVLAVEPWADDFLPILSRCATGAAAGAWCQGIVDAIKRGDAPLMVARASGGPPLGVAVLSFQKWPLPWLYVHAMAAVPKSGFRWGPAALPALRDLAGKAGALGVRCEARDAANRRRLGALGFREEASLMVARV